MASSVPSFFKPLTPNSTKRQLLCTYPFSGTTRSKLGEKMLDFDSKRLEKGSLVSAQKPVQVFSPQSKVKSKGSFFAFARCFAAITVLRHGLSGCLSLLLCAIMCVCSGCSIRHCFCLLRQYSGFASYSARFLALRTLRSLRSFQCPWELCHFIAWGRQQNFVRVGGNTTSHVRHRRSVCMAKSYTQNFNFARLEGALG